MARSLKQKHYDHGLWAESVAAVYLFFKGYHVLARRYKTPGGEIDLIAKRGRTLVFIEVKARAVVEDGLQAVNVRAQGRIEQAAKFFLSRYPQYVDYDMRFDLIAYAAPFSIRHLDNAWFGRS